MPVVGVKVPPLPVGVPPVPIGVTGVPVMVPNGSSIFSDGVSSPPVGSLVLSVPALLASSAFVWLSLLAVSVSEPVLEPAPDAVPSEPLETLSWLVSGVASFDRAETTSALGSGSPVFITVTLLTLIEPLRKSSLMFDSVTSVLAGTGPTENSIGARWKVLKLNVKFEYSLVSPKLNLPLPVST